MKEITIKIYGWSDLKKWFWDRFCFPRRKLVAEWLKYHNSEIRSIVERYIISCPKLSINSDADIKTLSAILRKYDKEIDEVTKRTEQLIMTK